MAEKATQSSTVLVRFHNHKQIVDADAVLAAVKTVGPCGTMRWRAPKVDTTWAQFKAACEGKGWAMKKVAANVSATARCNHDYSVVVGRES